MIAPAAARQTVLPRTNDAGFYEMRFESIGGLGANLAAQILAQALVLGQGFNGANFSSYGAEKKGSPVKAYIRLCAPEVRVRTGSPVERPHLLAIFHEALAGRDGTLSGLDPKGTVVVNSTCTTEELRECMRLPSGTVAAVDALGISVEEKTRSNTAMLGAIARAAGFVDPVILRDHIAAALGRKYPHLVEPNLRTFDRGYQEVIIEAFPYDGRFPFREWSRYEPPLGYLNSPIGGAILNAGNTEGKDLSTSRQGFVPKFHRDKCIDCGLCEMTCPDYCFEWEEGADKKGQPAMVLKGIKFQYCKGCLKCIEICPVDALTQEREDVKYPVGANVRMIGPAEAFASMERVRGDVGTQGTHAMRKHRADGAARTIDIDEHFHSHGEGEEEEDGH